MKNLMGLGIMVMSLGFIVGGSRAAIADIPIQKDDADILGVITVVDQNEIQVGQLAQQKNINRYVLDYAKMLERDHSKNLDQVHRLAEKLGLSLQEESGTPGHLVMKGQEQAASLSSTDRGDFERKFIDAMIEGHAEVLAWISAQSTANGEVRRFLNETRDHIAMHLQKAKNIRDHVLR